MTGFGFELKSIVIIISPLDSSSWLVSFLSMTILSIFSHDGENVRVPVFRVINE